ncbi:MAG: LysR family transcriptional regulator [Pseudomonadota bacterium]
MTLKPPPRPDLPLTALRAFEAAARLGGFRAAGDELGVSAAAVSAQVKGLEARLGYGLFRRGARGVVLTEAGALVRPRLSAVFHALDAAQVSMLAGADRALEVAALPAIAQLWLPERMATMEAAGHRVSVTAMEAPPTGKRARFDLALFYGPGKDLLVPVAAPGVSGPRLSDAAWARDWVLWAEGSGAPAPPAGATFSLYSMVVEAALRGAGVAMGRWSLVASLVEAGRLVEVGARVPIQEGIVATRGAGMRHPALAAFEAVIGHRD